MEIKKAKNGWVLENKETDETYVFEFIDEEDTDEGYAGSFCGLVDKMKSIFGLEEGRFEIFYCEKNPKEHAHVHVHMHSDIQ